MTPNAVCRRASAPGLCVPSEDALVPCAEDGPLTWLLQTRGHRLCAHTPVGTLGAFLYTLLGRLEVGHGLLVVALSYVRRLPLGEENIGSLLECGHCAVVGCLVLAAKYLEDNHRPTYATWTQAAQLPRATLQTLELQTLQALGYRLHVQPTAFRALCRAYEADRVVRSWHYVSRLGLPIGAMLQASAPTPPPTPPYTPPLHVPGTPTPPALSHAMTGPSLKRAYTADASDGQQEPQLKAAACVRVQTPTTPRWPVQAGTQ
eukprot:comp16813_c0_seq1/m.15217 comp16813_c0_seq1/g.15217  ORF comp16813_c0_seq1/g.15217 comp16813_c0_seq1/m.15217 type:complete len:261 (-) comp16813_c0_seq1:410-1192(-)